MDGTLHCQRNQCQWISSTESITGHSILEAGKWYPTKMVPKLKTYKKKKKKSSFINSNKNYKNQKKQKPKLKKNKSRNIKMNFDRRSRPFDNNQHFHHQHTTNWPYLHHWQENQNFKSTHHDYSQREHWNQNVLTHPSLEHPLPSNPPLITPSTRSPSVLPINTTLVKNHILFHKDLERHNY